MPRDDRWLIEMYYKDASRPAHRIQAVSGGDAVLRMQEALAVRGIGGVVCYRPPDHRQEEDVLLSREGSGYGLPPMQDPVAWLNRHDHDKEFHETIRVLLHPAGTGRPKVAEAVLMLEHYIGTTAPVRAQVDGWGDEWAHAVTHLSNSRSVSQVRAVQHLLRATTSKPKGI